MKSLKSHKPRVLQHIIDAFSLKYKRTFNFFVIPFEVEFVGK